LTLLTWRNFLEEFFAVGCFTLLMGLHVFCFLLQVCGNRAAKQLISGSSR